MKSIVSRAAAAVIAAWTACVGCRAVATPGASEFSDWKRHQDPRGFAVSLPPQWSLSAGKDARITLRSADKNVFVVIQPFFLRESLSARKWLEQTPERFADLFPGARLTRVRTRDGVVDEAIGALQFGEGRGRATLLCSIEARSAMFYAIAAPVTQFLAKRATLVRILETFSFTPPTPASSVATIPSVRWTEPNEEAFSFEAPRGWQVAGGLKRISALDYRVQVDVVSPDGKIRLRAGDETLMTYSEPNALAEAQGYREGSIAPVQPGVLSVKMARYFPGARFAHDYLQYRIAPRYQEVSFASDKDRPDVAQPIARAYRNAYSAVGEVTLDAGETQFTARTDRGRVEGYGFALTWRLRSPTTSLWWAPQVYSYVADADHVATARAALARLIATTRYEPTWVARQALRGGQTASAYSQLIAQSSEAMYQSFRSWQAGRDEHMHQFVNALTDQTDVRDPATGETWKISSGHNYYWRRVRDGAIVGADTGDRPDIDFSLLKEW